MLGENGIQDKQADRDRCEYAIVERGNYIPFDREATYEGIIVYFVQEVVIECQKCGESNRVRDYDNQKTKTIEYDDEDPDGGRDDFNGVHIEHGPITRTFDDLNDHTQP